MVSFLLLAYNKIGKQGSGRIERVILRILERPLLIGRIERMVKSRVVSNRAHSNWQKISPMLDQIIQNDSSWQPVLRYGICFALSYLAGNPCFLKVYV